MDKIGNLLKQKRLEKGMTIEAVSEKTRLTTKHIKAIEEGDISYFKDDLSYLRFFLKAYCDALDLDFDLIKGDLQESINDYTFNFTRETLMEHAQIEQGIQRTNEKMKQPGQGTNKKQKMQRLRNWKNHHRIDMSLISFLAIIVVILIGLIFAFVMWFQGSKDTGSDMTENKPPIATPTYTHDPDPVPEVPISEPEEEEPKEMAITKESDDSSQAIYAIENLKADDEIDIEVTFSSDSSFRVLVNDKELSDPPRGIRPYRTVLHVREKAAANKKIVLAFGFMWHNSIKINGKQLEIPAALFEKQGSALITFNVKGE